jgi:hypothetical protein
MINSLLPVKMVSATLFPSLCCRNLKLINRILRKLSRKKYFIVPAQTQWTCVQRLNPKNKEVSPYIPLQAGYRSRK